MKNLIFISGPPCSGKSTLASELHMLFKVPIISIGEIVREISKRENIDIATLCPAPDYLCVREEEVREELILLIEKLGLEDNNPVIIEGFPRNAEQYHFIKEYTEKFNRYSMSVMLLHGEEDELCVRMQNRRREGDTHERLMAGIKMFEELKAAIGQTRLTYNINYKI